MDEVEQRQQVRLQRRLTVAAIQQAEGRARGQGDHNGFTNLIDLYLRSLEVHTVAGLVEIEIQARAYLPQLYGEPEGPA